MCLHNTISRVKLEDLLNIYFANLLTSVPCHVVVVCLTEELEEYTFVENEHKIFSKVIFLLPLIQEVQFLITGIRLGT